MQVIYDCKVKLKFQVFLSEKFPTGVAKRIAKFENVHYRRPE